MNHSAPSGFGATRASAVEDELRRQILSGELAAGTHLRQAELAARFDVSTTPVREALGALARMGLVRHDAQRGAVVFTPTAEDVRENYEMRIALEPLAAELAAKSLHAEQLRHLDEVIAGMRESDNQTDYQRLNREFHRTIYASAGRPRLLEIIESLRDAFEAYIQLEAAGKPDPQYLAMAHEQHEAIAVALKDRDPKRAGKLVKRHLKDNAAHYLQTSATLDRRVSLPDAI